MERTVKQNTFVRIAKRSLNLSLLTLTSTALVVLLSAQTSLAANSCGGIFLKSQGLLKLKTEYATLAKGRTVAFQRINAKPGMPTLVLLPGVNRSLPSDYPALKLLADEGYGLLSLATSSHWESLRHLKDRETPFYEQKTDLSSVDFKNEVEALIQKLQISDTVLVSLSYSSSIAAQSEISGIYVAPMVKASDSDPQAAKMAAAWEAGLAMNPFFGKIWIRQFRDTNYKNFWSKQVFENGGSKAYDNVDATTVIDGYVSISRAAENFNLENAKFSNEGSNFLLGERESEVRLKGQFAAVKKAAAAGPTRMILVVGAEHNVPDTAPVAYSLGLSQLLQPNQASKGLLVGVLNPEVSLDVQWLTPAQSKKLFQYVDRFGESTAEADLTAVLKAL
jgi:hypothetical protein